MPKIEVVKSHLNAIIVDGKLTGIIYHDIEKRSKIIYKCEEMNEEEIVKLISKEQ